MKTAAAEAWIRKNPELPVPAKFNAVTQVFPPKRSFIQMLRSMDFPDLQAELGDLIRGGLKAAVASELREIESDSTQVKAEMSVDLRWE